MSENPHSPEDWRQVSEEPRAVTHTDERRVTPVRNQFQELSEHQENPTPRLALRELIAAFSRLPPEDDNIYILKDENDDNAETGSIGSTKSFDTMTDITNDYGCLMEIIRLVNAKQATVFSGKKKNYANIVKLREVLGSALAAQPCSGRYGGYSWLVDTEEDYTHRVGATKPYTVQSMPKGPPMPAEPQNPLHPANTSDTQSTNKSITNTSTDLLQLEENQSQLAHAYKISQTNHVPSEVRTEPSTLSSSVTGSASAYFTTNDINTNLETKLGNQGS
jgi:hypothetical protein